MQVIVTLLVIFALAALGIVVYYKTTAEGKVKDVEAILDDASTKQKQAAILLRHQQKMKELDKTLNKLKEGQ